jgi:hypothetical protein
MLQHNIRNTKLVFYLTIRDMLMWCWSNLITEVLVRPPSPSSGSMEFVKGHKKLRFRIENIEAMDTRTRRIDYTFRTCCYSYIHHAFILRTCSIYSLGGTEPSSRYRFLRTSTCGTCDATLYFDDAVFRLLKACFPSKIIEEGQCVDLRVSAISVHYIFFLSFGRAGDGIDKLQQLKLEPLQYLKEDYRKFPVLVRVLT